MTMDDLEPTSYLSLDMPSEQSSSATFASSSNGGSWHKMRRLPSNTNGSSNGVRIADISPKRSPLLKRLGEDAPIAAHHLTPYPLGAHRLSDDLNAGGRAGSPEFVALSPVLRGQTPRASDGAVMTSSGSPKPKRLDDGIDARAGSLGADIAPWLEDDAAVSSSSGGISPLQMPSAGAQGKSSFPGSTIGRKSSFNPSSLPPSPGVSLRHGSFPAAAPRMVNETGPPMLASGGDRKSSQSSQGSTAQSVRTTGDLAMASLARSRNYSQESLRLEPSGRFGSTTGMAASGYDISGGGGTGAASSSSGGKNGSVGDRRRMMSSALGIFRKKTSQSQEAPVTSSSRPSSGGSIPEAPRFGSTSGKISFRRGKPKHESEEPAQEDTVLGTEYRLDTDLEDMDGIIDHEVLKKASLAPSAGGSSHSGSLSGQARKVSYASFASRGGESSAGMLARSSSSFNGDPFAGPLSSSTIYGQTPPSPHSDLRPIAFDQSRRPSNLRHQTLTDDSLPRQESARRPSKDLGGATAASMMFNTDPFGVKDKAAASQTAAVNGAPANGAANGAALEAAWQAPESWGVEGEEDEDQEGASSDEVESLHEPEPEPEVVRGNPPPFGYNSGRRRPNTASRSLGRPGTRGAASSRPNTSSSAHAASQHFIRIYSADGTYTTMSWPLHATTHDITMALVSKSPKTRANMKLYIRERGQDRQLLPSEKPVAIQLRRLLQAGYSDADRIEEKGRENLAMLCRFIFQVPYLPTLDPDDESSYESFELVDLGGRDLQAVPIFLYKHAHSIISLNLSRNPMSDLPLDFVQACTTLRELRMTHMAMKRIPASIRQAVALTRLDISCNRIVDLEHAGLQDIQTLVSLKAQNNRLTSIPDSFVRLKSLKYLNISNNKFTEFPAVVCKIRNLVDLDVSFNEIVEFPAEMCHLTHLERLVAVGNALSTFPESFSTLGSLRELDVRRNRLTDLNAVYALPNLAMFQANDNLLVVLDAQLGSRVREFSVPHNSITRFTLAPSKMANVMYSLTVLDLSYGKLSTLAEDALGQLVNLETLNLNYNKFVRLPETMENLKSLKVLSCTENVLTSLPAGLGRLERLEVLNVHNNNLKELPGSIWQCKKLHTLNASSNLLDAFPDAPVSMMEALMLHDPDEIPRGDAVPPLASSLRKLYLADNQLTDDVFDPVSMLTELRVINLSFNGIYEIPTWTLSKMYMLEELYMSGNNLTSLPSEDFERLTSLRILHLNGNKLRTLPGDIGKIRNLATLDVGSNVLKYNIANWPYDWNWNWNLELRYLNLSGNKRLEIKPTSSHDIGLGSARGELSDFSKLTHLRVLGLMDVTLRIPTLPDESEDRRVRTSFSDINNMAYGISDTLGRIDHLSLFDLVVPNFRSKEDECVFGMFGRMDAGPHGSHVSKFVQEWFAQSFARELDSLGDGETPGDAMRRTFLSVNKHCFDVLSGLDSSRKDSMAEEYPLQANSYSPHLPHLKRGASGVVAYLVGKTLYVANVGDMAAVVSNQGEAEVLSVRHDPLDREETLRIRAAEAWVSPRGMVNDEIRVSRSFGYYNAVPAVNALPALFTRELTAADEFVIIGNRALWDYCSYQTAIDIARTEKDDPMVAAQKLRDFAIGYGAESSTMIMVINVGDLFKQRAGRADVDGDLPQKRVVARNRRAEDVGDRTLMRLQQEVEPPTGQVAIVFTDIKNSTSLWETNPGMQTAMRMHNSLLRRQLRIIGGYEVKTEGDAFMVSFPTVASAVLWAFTCQLQLLNEDWPREILECEDGREVLDSHGERIQRGLSVRMGIHWGTPVWERDPITRRMDYFGPMVNKSSRVSASADGGQIMASNDVLKEVRGIIDYLEAGEGQEPEDVGRDVIQLQRLGLGVLDMGERKLKGLEVPEKLFLIYPKALAGRLELSTDIRDNVEVKTAKLYGGEEDRILGLEELRQLVSVCFRLEALTVDKVSSERQDLADIPAGKIFQHSSFHGPRLHDDMSDEDLLAITESLTARIANSVSTLVSYSSQVERRTLIFLGSSHGSYMVITTHWSRSRKPRG